jgi:hypothetical protein
MILGAADFARRPLDWRDALVGIRSQTSNDVLLDYNFDMSAAASASLCALDLRGALRPTVLLRHDLPDGSHHFDWMIATDPPMPHDRQPRLSGPLLTFRLDDCLVELAHGKRLQAIHITDHRPFYLDYEGPIEGDRGRVKRVARGSVVNGRLLASPPHEVWEIAVVWSADDHQPTRSQIVRLTRQVPADTWDVTVQPRVEGFNHAFSGCPKNLPGPERPSAVH